MPTQAKLAITFYPELGARRGKVLTVTITMPNGCDLKNRTERERNGVGGDGISLVSQTLGLANGAACEWAIDWLGLGDRADQIRTAGAGRRDRREASAPGDDKASKVVEIVAGCNDPEGTCVQTYLSARGITARPLPPCIRYRANAYGRYAALVALSTDAAGAVHAVQQIYLTSNGRKAPIKVQKRTNKARDDWSDLAAVRLPGTTPIVLTEGVETALSVWQATGYETWACLGISNIARAPVPDGMPVVVARDGDEAGSKADNQIRRAVTILRGQGREVTVAEPLPGKDFNDILVEEGEDAVRARLQAPVSADLYSTSWRAGLLLNDEGEPRPILANAIHALRHAPEWDGVLWHNEFATTTVARKPPPWAAGAPGWEDMPWSDRDDYLVAEWLQRQGIMAPASVAGQGVETVARDRVFHPVREYLDNLAWDGTAPIRHYLESEVQWSENGYGERKPYYIPRPEPLNDTSVAEVLEHALRIERGRWSQVDQNRVVRCLVSMGFKRHKVRRNGEREWRYLRDPDTRAACGPTGPTS